MNWGKGDVKGQRKRQQMRKAAQTTPRQKELYQCIDGNLTHYPAAFCLKSKGYMTEGLMNTHQCVREKWTCPRLRPLEFDKKGKVTSEDYFQGEGKR